MNITDKCIGELNNIYLLYVSGVVQHCCELEIE